MSSKPISSTSLSRIKKDFAERKDFEQYFWREEMLQKILKDITNFYHQECIYNGLYLKPDGENWLQEKDPKFRYYTLTISENVEKVEDSFQIFIIDPPYEYYSENSFQWLYKAVCKIVEDNFQAKILIAFSTRHENVAMKYFEGFGLKPTSFDLIYNKNEYKPNKWEKFCLYSNFNLPGIKQINK